MWTIILFLAILSFLVFVHEAGHFFVAKKMGMAVEEFGFGFPPRAWSVKRGGTTYSVNWIPLGGFVRLKGENGEERRAPDSFASKPVWRRFLVLVAGVAMNFLAAAVVLSASLMIGAPSALSGGALPAGASVRDAQLQIETVVAGSPADKAGIRPGDALVSLGGQAIAGEEAARAYIQAHPDGVTAVVRAASGSVRTLTLVPAPLPAAGRARAVGVGLLATGIVSLPFGPAVAQGFAGAAGMVRDVVLGLIGLIRQLIVQHQVSAELSGPVGIAVMTGDVAKLGVLYVLPFVAVLSANLAVINALPFPALDGGRILFLAMEKLRGKPADERVEALVHNIGFLVLLALILLVTVHDFLHLGVKT